MRKLIFLLMLSVVSVATAHQQAQPALFSAGGTVTYLGNTGLLVTAGQQQVLFDPFFHSHFNHYQLVPETLRQAMFAGNAPFDSVDVVLISHAHGDHFDAADVVSFLSKHDQVMLVAPSQAVEQMQPLAGFNMIKNRIKAINLAYGDAPVTHQLGEIEVNAVRIPHAGWPGRAEVSNLVYRVTLNGETTVMHMGDADPDDLHFKPWREHWEAMKTDRAYPPYWFMLTPAGQEILAKRINATSATGVHVPVKVPAALQQSGASYFSEPGTTQIIQHSPLSENN